MEIFNADVIWKPIKGYEGLYEVSNTGEVRSFLINSSGKILKKQNNSRKQHTVALHKNNKTKTVTVSRLVATAFLDHPLGKDVVCHNDNDPFNNSVSNLRWDTAMGNELDKFKFGTTNSGETNGRSKLSEADVLNIHKMRLEGIPNKEIALKYGITTQTVCAILNFRYWRHLKDVIKPKENHITLKERPFIIEGGNFIDDRGSLKFANAFDFFGIKRFYNVSNIEPHTVRAWHGHNQEGKVFFASVGTFVVGVVDMGTEKLEKFILSDQGSTKLLWVPAGYFNGFMNLTKENNLTIFSTSSVEESMGDDIRLPFDKWDIWKVEYR